MNAPTITAPLTGPVVPMIPTKRPRPYIRAVRSIHAPNFAWEPFAIPLYSVINGVNVRAGEAYACVRPGWERWPLGVVSDHYKVVSHNETRRAIFESASELVSFGGAIMAGHGYHVAQSFFVKHMQAGSVEGAPVTSRLVVAHDHTGKGALRAVMVVYVGDEPMGAVVRSRAIHAGSQPTHWAGEIDSMIEKSILAQDVLIDLFTAAKARKLNDIDREWLAKKGLIAKKGKKAATLFEACIAWHSGTTSPNKMTWGVWERRLDDEAIRVMCEMLGLAKYGSALDDILGGKRYGRGMKLAPPKAETDEG